MIIDDFDIYHTGLRPAEADPPLVVYPDGVLPLPIALQGFQPVARRRPQILQIGGQIDSTKTALRTSDEIGRKSLGSFAGRYLLDELASR